VLAENTRKEEECPCCMGHPASFITGNQIPRRRPGHLGQLSDEERDSGSGHWLPQEPEGSSQAKWTVRTRGCAFHKTSACQEKAKTKAAGQQSCGSCQGELFCGSQPLSSCPIISRIWAIRPTNSQTQQVWCVQWLQEPTAEERLCLAERAEGFASCSGSVNDWSVFASFCL